MGRIFGRLQRLRPRLRLRAGSAVLLGVWACLAACLSTARAWGAQATLVADAHVNSAMPAANSGAISNLDVGGGYTTLLQFDLSQLPAGTTAAQVSRAVLRLYANRVTTPGSVTISPVTEAWGEYSVTYANEPTVGSAAGTFSVSQAGAFLAVDVTSLVQGWISNPATNNGLALSAGTAIVQFDSKENDQTAHAATLDVELVDAGPTGATGATGATGPAGPQGPTGATGPVGATGMAGTPGLAGATGPVGATGPSGPQGVTGATGPVGATGAVGTTGTAGPPGQIGPTGPQGPVGPSSGGGLDYQGTYASTTNYALGDLVAFQGSSYISLIASNHGNTPGSSPAQWGLLASAGLGATGATGAAGPMGPMGLSGATGAIGPAGPTGATGATGNQGTPGLVYLGNYSSSQNYAQGDVVLWQGSSYTSLIASNHGNTPSLSPLQWGVLSAQGPTGPTGATGASGAAGPQGLPGSVGANGPIGLQGLQGIAGQAGAQGIPGATGATGLSGPMGPQGIAGPVGLAFQGVYSSVVNYALADGVSYKGAGYVSLVAGNHGNTPDQSPQQWALFAAAGASGAIGPAGATGATGATGAVGPQGLSGPTGATGSTGPQGPPVANYLGNYQSSMNYARNDAVSWQGSTYISLIASNHGNTPDLSPAQWAVLAAQGATGGTGPAGLAGAAGATGAAGANGATGPQGPPMTFRGEWLIGTSYAIGDAVAYGGSSYIALSANVGREPDMSPVYWGLLVEAGAAGPAGPAGATGLQGPTGYPGPMGLTGAQGPVGPFGPPGATGAVGATGPAGPTGAMGATGLAGVVYQGTYVSATNYGLNDAVTYQGSSYISLAIANAGNTPGQSPAFWAVLAAQGTAGASGATGATGAQGLPGLPGAPGAAGAPGPVGATGATGMNFRGAWIVGTGYAANDAVTFGGSTYLAEMSNSSSEPDLYPQAWTMLAQAGGAGPSGPTGAAGAAATMTVGTVTTGAAGTQATVTNTGTSSAAVLNFTIPQGAAGPAGSGGSGGGAGISGIPFTSIYHLASSNSLTYYSVNNSAGGLTELASVLTWVPAGCTATQLNVFSQQAQTVTVTLRLGTPGSMANTALTCSVAPGPPGALCTVPGVVIPAGSFVDLSITGANGPSSPGIWTALACN